MLINEKSKMRNSLYSSHLCEKHEGTGCMLLNAQGQ